MADIEKNESALRKKLPSLKKLFGPGVTDAQWEDFFRKLEMESQVEQKKEKPSGNV